MQELAKKPDNKNALKNMEKAYKDAVASKLCSAEDMPLWTKTPLVLQINNKLVKPELETIVAFTQGNVSTCALRRDWALAWRDALALSNTCGSQLLRNFIRTLLDKSSDENASRAAAILVEVSEVLLADCNPDFGAHLKALKDMCLWSQLSSFELKPTLDHISSHSDDTLWMCFCLCERGAAMMASARAKVKDAQQSEEDDAKIKELEKDMAFMKSKLEGIEDAANKPDELDDFMEKVFVEYLNKYMKEVCNFSKATLESRTKSNLVPIVDEVNTVLGECKKLRQQASKDTVGDLLKFLNHKTLQDICTSDLMCHDGSEIALQLKRVGKESKRLQAQYKSLICFCDFMPQSPAINFHLSNNNVVLSCALF